MRMDRLAGAISSELCNDFEREWRVADDAPDSPVSPIDRSRSDSDSEDMPDEVELDDNALVPFVEVRLLNVIFPLSCSPPEFPSSVAAIPRVWAVDARLDPPAKAVPNFRIFEIGAKWPLSSYRHAIKYTPGAASVETIPRIDSNRVTEILLGI